MPVNAAAENALGTMGAICWSVQLIPQIWKSWRTKSTDGLSHWLVLLWSLASIPLGVYVIVQNLNIPLIIQPELFGAFTLISWTQCMYYNEGRSLRWCLTMLIAVSCISAGLQVGFVFALRSPYRRGEESAKRGAQFFGILSSVMISLALLPQYYEIYKHRAVVGISITFMAIDLLGGIFSDLSLVFKSKFDVIAAMAYSLVVVLDGFVILAALILNPRARRRARQQAEAADSTDLPSGHVSTGVTHEDAVVVSAADKTLNAHGEDEKDRSSGHSVGATTEIDRDLEEGSTTGIKATSLSARL